MSLKGSGHKLERRMFPLEQGSTSVLCRHWSTSTDCPEVMGGVSSSVTFRSLLDLGLGTLPDGPRSAPKHSYSVVL